MGQADLPLASGDEHVKAFTRLGWKLQPKRGKGSHMVLTKAGMIPTLSIPAHREVKRALLAKQIKNAGVTEAEYLAAFNA